MCAHALPRAVPPPARGHCAAHVRLYICRAGSARWRTPAHAAARGTSVTPRKCRCGSARAARAHSANELRLQSIQLAQGVPLASMAAAALSRLVRGTVARTWASCSRTFSAASIPMQTAATASTSATSPASSSTSRPVRPKKAVISLVRAPGDPATTTAWTMRCCWLTRVPSTHLCAVSVLHRFRILPVPCGRVCLLLVCLSFCRRSD